MQSEKYLKQNNFPEHIKMEWDLLDLFVSILFSPYSTYKDNYYIEITSEELKLIYNSYFSDKDIDYDFFYDILENNEPENDEDIDIDENEYINNYYNIDNIFDKKYGKNGILYLLMFREGVVMKNNKFDKNDIVFNIYPNLFLNGLSSSYERDIDNMS